MHLHLSMCLLRQQCVYPHLRSSACTRICAPVPAAHAPALAHVPPAPSVPAPAPAPDASTRTCAPVHVAPAAAPAHTPPVSAVPALRSLYPLHLRLPAPTPAPSCTALQQHPHPQSQHLRTHLRPCAPSPCTCSHLRPVTPAHAPVPLCPRLVAQPCDSTHTRSPNACACTCAPYL